MKNKILVIVGPTAVGKTELALILAQKFQGEVISADSRQIYQEMDIGTGKDLPVKAKCFLSEIHWRQRNIPVYQFKGINIWLYDVVKPDENFSAADYFELANQVIKYITKQGKLPILVGGTGFYIKALIDGLDTLGILPDQKLRSKLNQETVSELQLRLKKLNPLKLQKMNNSDRNNPRRLIRAIEVELNKKKLISQPVKNQFKPLFIGLTASKEILYQRIKKRIEKRLKQGIIQEIKNLQKKGYSWNLPALTSLGYWQFKDYLQGKKTLKEVVKNWQIAEYQYAKRQLTWFKKDPRIIWYDITREDFQETLLAKISLW